MAVLAEVEAMALVEAMVLAAVTVDREAAGYVAAAGLQVAAGLQAAAERAVEGGLVTGYHGKVEETLHPARSCQSTLKQGIMDNAHCLVEIASACLVVWVDYSGDCGEVCARNCLPARAHAI